MTCHIMVQSLFLGQTRLGVILISTDAIAYWQIRAINPDGRQQSQRLTVALARTDARSGAQV